MLSKIQGKLLIWSKNTLNNCRILFLKEFHLLLRVNEEFKSLFKCQNKKNEYNGTQNAKWPCYRFSHKISWFEVYGPISIIIKIIFRNFLTFSVIFGRFTTNFVILLILFRFLFAHSEKTCPSYFQYNNCRISQNLLTFYSIWYCRESIFS